MKLFVTSTIALLIASCCCRYTDKDFEFAQPYNKLTSAYALNDTILFTNHKGDDDTIVVSKIDTLCECGCFMAGNRRSVSIRIKHLPNNSWAAGTDQEILTIEKGLDDTPHTYYIGINYREFMGELKDLSNITTDHRFQHLGISAYWTIPNDAANWPQYQSDSSIIIKAYWTAQYGLTAYELRNGTTYVIVKKQ